MAKKAPSKGARYKRGYGRQGLHQARNILDDYGTRALDGPTTTARSLQAWRDAVVDDLGGPDAISAQQLTVIDLAARC